MRLRVDSDPMRPGWRQPGRTDATRDFQPGSCEPFSSVTGKWSHIDVPASLPDWLDFRQRLFPSCNFTWINGPRPILVDTGFGSDLEETVEMLPGTPALVFNTHWHSDHVGGNAGLTELFQAPIAASSAEGQRINAGDPESFGAGWLDQPVARYHVDRLLEAGERARSRHGTLPLIPAPRHFLRPIGPFAGTP